MREEVLGAELAVGEHAHRGAHAQLALDDPVVLEELYVADDVHHAPALRAGLDITVVLAHGGTVELVNRPEGGAVFIVDPARERIADAVRTPRAISDNRRAGDYYRLVDGGERILRMQAHRDIAFKLQCCAF